MVNKPENYEINKRNFLFPAVRNLLQHETETKLVCFTRRNLSIVAKIPLRDTSHFSLALKKDFLQLKIENFVYYFHNFLACKPLIIISQLSF